MRLALSPSTLLHMVALLGSFPNPKKAGKVMAKVEVPNSRPIKVKKRPSMLLLPSFCPINSGFVKKKIGSALEKKEIQVEGKYFHLASKKGSSREVMEDRYDVMVDVLGNPAQAFFAVIDGHGGTAAANFVAENLGKNILKAFEYSTGTEEQAIRKGYSLTDKEFLSQGIGSGACTACVLLKKGELHVANVGDCRVVMCRKGQGKPLTRDHRLNREDERLRIEKSGGFVHNRHGVLRVQGALAVSRAIGDLHLKHWIISEPDITRFHLTSDCQFLIIASDGLWDKVGEQEAVDVVLKGKSRLDSCKELVDVSCRRGNTDDITVMVVDLGNFVQKSV